MKVIIPTTENSLDGEMDLRFARAPYFVIYDTEKNTTQIKQNPYKNGVRAVGTIVAQYIINEGIKVVVAKDVGPNAMMILNGAGIEIRNFFGSIKQALAQFE